VLNLLKPSRNLSTDNYTKKEFRIAMRDGVMLFTSVYMPKDSSSKYPFLIQRTPILWRHMAMPITGSVLVQTRSSQGEIHFCLPGCAGQAYE
jgi:predicted acyl esterase